ncbi:MAG: N-acetyl-gamma-glutamyl-phosphate reductase [Candidatus Omnitrophota bacterium]|jgi:N-acetyl-gamma-glutamyl-phosphate reductase
MDNHMIRAGIVGVSGYSGYSILEILLRHPLVRVTYVSANNTEGKVADLWPTLLKRTKLYCHKYNYDEAAEHCDLIFLAVPHTTAFTLVPLLLKAGIRVIDLSGDYRLKSTADYKAWYGAAHKDKANLKNAIYGLPELFRLAIRDADLVSNPGCYPTAAILSLAPMVAIYTKDIEQIIIDAKSGVSGAGKKLSPAMMFGEIHENFRAYKVNNHQHTPEIEQFLSHIADKKMDITFVPHLLPLFRGILETIYVKLTTKISLPEIHALYQRFYKTETFIRILPLGTQAETQHVRGTNFCDISLDLNKTRDTLIITSVIDNLVKGAAGQAVQNMNIMCDFEEELSLI